MNTTALTGLAALIRGGLTGYKDAKGMQRQAALDEAQQRKDADTMALKEAALRAQSQSAAEKAALQADKLKLQTDNAQLTEEERLRKNWQAGWGVGNDPEFSDLRGPFMGLADDYAKAPMGPKPGVDQYGVIEGADEWNEAPLDHTQKASKGFIEAKGDLVLRDVAKRQAEITTRKHKQDLEKIDRKGAQPAKAPPVKTLPAATVKDLSSIEGTIVRLKSSFGKIASVENKIALGRIPNKVQDALELFNAADPDVADLQQDVNYTQAEYQKLISGAALNEGEVLRLAKVVPTMKDSPAIIRRKIVGFAKIMDEVRTRLARDYAASGYKADAFSSPLDTKWADPPPAAPAMPPSFRPE